MFFYGDCDLNLGLGFAETGLGFINIFDDCRTGDLTLDFGDFC